MDCGQSECNLLSIPHEVVYEGLLPLLLPNDLLRLRRVCKQLKVFTDDYIRNQSFTTNQQEREINDDDYTFRDFIQCAIPNKQIYLNNSCVGPSIFEDSSIQQFLSLYAPSVTYLRVKVFTTPISPAENSFYTGLTNLEHLEINTIDATQLELEKDKQIPRAQSYFPPNFRNLKTLKLNNILCGTPADYDYVLDFINYCPKLGYLRCPPLPHPEYILKYFPEGPNLRFLDLQHINSTGLFSFQYESFTELCFNRGVKLVNVNAQLYDIEMDMEVEEEVFMIPPENMFYNTVASLINVNVAIFLEECPFLEKLVITETSLCSFPHLWGNMRSLRWPCLETLDVTINSQELAAAGNNEPRRTFDLLMFLFCTFEREKLKDVRIGFDRNESRKWGLPCPRIGPFTEKCRNVTKLTLTNWLGGNEAMLQFWSGLGHLEEVVLEDCKMLAIDAFVGEDTENPLFLKLTKLKKLTISGLELMPDITDRIFELIFRHLTVKQFYIRSRKPIKSVTVHGIRSLLTGKFNDYVERFPFDGWSLEGLSQEQFTHLKTEFRASYML